jgi:uncharacterized protein Smg (DUF494 family)
MRTDEREARADAVGELLDDHGCDLERVEDALWGLEELIQQSEGATGPHRIRASRATAAIAHVTGAFVGRARQHAERIREAARRERP